MSPFTCCAGSQKYTVVAIALGPASALGMLAISPGVSQALFSQSHQRRPTEVRSQDCSSCASGPAVGAIEAAQTLSWPSPRFHAPTKPTAAKAIPVPAMGAPIVRSDVSQALNLQSQRCKPAAHAAAGRDFSSAS